MAKARHLTDPNWFMVRKHEWPNGRVYFTVENRKGLGATGKSGGKSTFYDRKQAEEVRDRFNGKAPADDPLIE